MVTNHVTGSRPVWWPCPSKLAAAVARTDDDDADHYRSRRSQSWRRWWWQCCWWCWCGCWCWWWKLAGRSRVSASCHDHTLCSVHQELNLTLYFVFCVLYFVVLKSLVISNSISSIAWILILHKKILCWNHSRIAMVANKFSTILQILSIFAWICFEWLPFLLLSGFTTRHACRPSVMSSAPNNVLLALLLRSPSFHPWATSFHP